MGDEDELVLEGVEGLGTWWGGELPTASRVGNGKLACKDIWGDMEGSQCYPIVKGRVSPFQCHFPYP